MIEIQRPGLLTTVQDGGRKGYQAYGVPVCGAMDWLSLARANLLAGNAWDEAALEVTGLGPAVQFSESCVFALAGADFSAALNGRPLAAHNAGFDMAFIGAACERRVSCTQGRPAGTGRREKRLSGLYRLFGRNGYP